MVWLEKLIPSPESVKKEFCETMPTFFFIKTTRALSVIQKYKGQAHMQKKVHSETSKAISIAKE